MAGNAKGELGAGLSSLESKEQREEVDYLRTQTQKLKADARNLQIERSERIRNKEKSERKLLASALGSLKAARERTSAKRREVLRKIASEKQLPEKNCVRKGIE